MPALKYKLQRFSSILITCLILSFSACSLYNVDTDPQPLVQGGDKFSTISADELSPDQDQPWWLCFEDQELSKLIEAGLDKNLDLAQALARLQAANAVVTRSWAGLFPQLFGIADSGYNWDNVDSGRRSRAELSNYGASLNWEIDLFGRLASIANTREYERRARFEDLNDLKLFLTAQIADTYFRIVADRQGLDLLDQQIKSASELLDLTELRFDAGIAANVDILQQKSLLQEIQSIVPQAKGLLRQNENRLDVLLGQAPDGIGAQNLPTRIINKCTISQAGVPGDLLIKRPDLRALLNDLIAADADKARAIAERLPSISIGASYLKSHGDGLHNSGATAFIDLLAPLIDFGQRRAEVGRADAIYQERLARFSQGFLTAIEEVENLLYQIERQSELLKIFEERKLVLAETLKETRARYEQGLTDYLPVLTAQQQLQTVERGIVVEEFQQVSLKISLFRALGLKFEEQKPSNKPQENDLIEDPQNDA